MPFVVSLPILVFPNLPTPARSHRERERESVCVCVHTCVLCFCVHICVSVRLCTAFTQRLCCCCASAALGRLFYDKGLEAFILRFEWKEMSEFFTEHCQVCIRFIRLCIVVLFRVERARHQSGLSPVRSTIRRSPHCFLHARTHARTHTRKHHCVPRAAAVHGTSHC